MYNCHIWPLYMYVMGTWEHPYNYRESTDSLIDWHITSRMKCEYTSVAGMVTMISTPDSGSTVSWSPPDPPNGVILYYNIRINNSDNGDLVAFIQEQNVTSIDVAVYGESGGKYTVEVKDVYITRCTLHILLQIIWFSCTYMYMCTCRILCC